MKHSLFAALVLAHSTVFATAQQLTPTHPGLVYATLGNGQLELDLYIPATGSPPYPLWIYIHGGGWSSGGRFPMPTMAQTMVQQGFAVASIDYRLTSQAAQFAPLPVIFPAQIHDVKGAVRWLRANAATYQLDPARFGACGKSAGGHLAALLAMSGGAAALEGDVGGNLTYSSAVQAAVDYFGPTDLLHINDDVTTPPGSLSNHDAPGSMESRLLGWSGPGQGIGDIKAHLTDPTPPYPALVLLANQANPITWVDAGDPPTFIGHGTNDTKVPLNQSVRLSAALFAAGVPHDFRAIPGMPHGTIGAVGDSAAVAFMAGSLLGTMKPDAGTPFCAGDGSAAACPCGNTTLSGAQLGCLHSLVVGGNLNAIGTPSISADSLVLRGDSMPDSNVLYIQGSAAAAGGAGIVFGDGLLCVGGTVRRLGPKTNSAGFSRYPVAGDVSVSAKGGAIAGATLYYQVWFRDGAAHCASETWNLTNALAITWLP